MTKDWIALFLFFGLLAGAAVFEAVWLVRKGWASGSRAAAFVAVSDLLSFCVAALIYFVAAFIMLMLVFVPAGTGASEGSESTMWVTVIAAAVFPPLCLFLVKRSFLAVLRIQSGRTAWIYSLAVTAAICIVSIVPPALFFYLI